MSGQSERLAEAIHQILGRTCIHWSTGSSCAKWATALLPVVGLLCDERAAEEQYRLEAAEAKVAAVEAVVTEFWVWEAGRPLMTAVTAALADTEDAGGGL